jgi:hypothetical protein
MTFPVELGWEPIPVTVLLSMGQDWIIQLVPQPGSPSPLYPVGTTATVYVYPATTDTTQPVTSWTQLDAWPGIFNGDNVVWKVESSVTDLIPTGALIRIRIAYVNTPTPDTFNWAKGTVQRND